MPGRDGRARADSRSSHDVWREAEKKAKQKNEQDEDIEEVKKYIELLEGKPGLAKMLAQYKAKLEKLGAP